MPTSILRKVSVLSWLNWLQNPVSKVFCFIRRVYSRAGGWFYRLIFWGLPTHCRFPIFFLNHKIPACLLMPEFKNKIYKRLMFSSTQITNIYLVAPEQEPVWAKSYPDARCSKNLQPEQLYGCETQS